MDVLSLKHRVLPIGLIVLSACVQRDILSPSADRAVLIGAVVAGADSVFVALGRSGIGQADRPIAGATVSMSAMPTSSGFSPVSFAEVESDRCGSVLGFACYAARQPTKLSPGDTLRLAGTADGVPFRGKALVPSLPPVEIVGNAPTDTVRIGSLSENGGPILRFEETPGDLIIDGEFVGEVIAWFDETAEACTGVSLSFGRNLSALSDRGTSEIVLDVPVPGACPSQPAAWDSMAVEFPVVHYDLNLTRWRRTGAITFDGDGPGLAGINGVFGAATLRIFVVVATP